MLSTKALLGISLALLGGSFAASCRDSEGSPPAEAVRAGAHAMTSTAASTAGDTTVERRADHGRIEGSASAPLWVVEVSDFQCPFCKRWHEETYPAIKREYVDAGKVRLAYINFPLSGHRNAWPAAEAAMCASAQGKFWPMHDALFATQERWEELANPGALFGSLATQVGVDTAAYRACVTRHETRAMIQADIDRAVEAGVNSTPSFLIGGTMVRGAQPPAVFRSVIDSALAAAATKKS